MPTTPYGLKTALPRHFAYRGPSLDEEGVNDSVTTALVKRVTRVMRGGVQNMCDVIYEWSLSIYQKWFMNINGISGYDIPFNSLQAELKLLWYDDKSECFLFDFQELVLSKKCRFKKIISVKKNNETYCRNLWSEFVYLFIFYQSIDFNETKLLLCFRANSIPILLCQPSIENSKLTELLIPSLLAWFGRICIVAKKKIWCKFAEKSGYPSSLD